MAQVVSTEVKFTSYPWRSRAGKDGFPDGVWSFRRDVSGDVSGGSMTINAQMTLKQITNRFYSVEQVGVESDSAVLPANVGIAIQSNIWRAIDGIAEVRFRVAMVAVTGIAGLGILSELNTGLAMFPIFGGGMNLDPLPADPNTIVSYLTTNDNGVRPRFSTWGFWWDVSRLVRDGTSPRRP